MAHIVEVGRYTDIQKDVGFATGIFLNESYAFIADGRVGLEIIDISNPQEPFEVAQFKLQKKTAGGAHQVFIDQNIAYVAYDSKGIVILKVPTAPPLKPHPTTKMIGFSLGVEILVVSILLNYKKKRNK